MWGLCPPFWLDGTCTNKFLLIRAVQGSGVKVLYGTQISCNETADDTDWLFVKELMLYIGWVWSGEFPSDLQHLADFCMLFAKLASWQAGHMWWEWRLATKWNCFTRSSLDTTSTWPSKHCEFNKSQGSIVARSARRTSGMEGILIAMAMPWLPGFCVGEEKTCEQKSDKLVLEGEGVSMYFQYFHWGISCQRWYTGQMTSQPCLVTKTCDLRPWWVALY